MVLLVDGAVEYRSSVDRDQEPFLAFLPVSVENLAGKLEDGFLHLPFIDVRHYGQSHIPGSEPLPDEFPQLRGSYLPDACRRSQDGLPEGVVGQQGLFELVVDIVGRGVLVGVDFIDDHSSFDFDLFFREGRAGGQFQQQRRSLAQVFLENRRMNDYLFLSGECVQLASKLVEITVDDPGTLVPGTLEQRMLREMGYSVVEVSFVACSALDRQGTVADRIAALLDCILHPAGRLTGDHLFLMLLMAFRSLARKPFPFFEVILCFLK